VFISQKLLRRKLTVGVLRGEFVKFREPSDHVKEKEGYGGWFLRARSGGIGLED
jgi:hypothetical protein